MGTITIDINDNIEKQFRALAKKVYHDKKGYLGNVVTCALQKWIDEVTQKQIAERELKILDKGFDMGKLKCTSRKELYEI
ncbi:MAG: hypothetical protein O8C61_01235 [Candidatus Methanoperedens sp.]|nr:hypothetical protein [Candidatus Methanoperedens sp.]